MKLFRKLKVKYRHYFKKYPKTMDEAVNLLLNEMHENGLNEVKNSSKKDLSQFHFGLGMALRNEFGLWGRNPELLKSTGEEHPDDASGVIIKALWEKLQETK